MALQSSGQISLNDIHIEAGGTSGTQASINDSDIRALISKASGVQMSFSEWYGASSSLYSGTVTVGSAVQAYVGTFYGFGPDGAAHGSISPTSSSNFFSGSTIRSCDWLDGASGNDTVFLSVFGNHSNGGFTTLQIGSNSYSRTSAGYVYISNGNYTQWSWSANNANPFGTTTGATRAITIS